MFRFQKKSLALANDYLLCLSGEEIFGQEKFKSYLSEIKNLVSCPENLYRELYLATLFKLAEFCQAMPFSISDFNNPYGFLDRQLGIAITALKLRRGILFPKNAGTEKISAEEAQWTYALFSCALLKDLHFLQSDREVDLHKENQEKSGVWSTIAGSLYKKTYYYNMRFVTRNVAVSTDVIMAALSGHILPAIVPQWFSKNYYLYKQWWNVITHQSSAENEIEKIIKMVDEKRKVTPASLSFSNVVKANSKEEFVSYLINEIELNPELIFKMNNGLFVSINVIEDFLSANRFTSKHTFMQSLEKESWLVLNDTNTHHVITPKKLEDRRALHGIILNIDALPHVLKRLPINSYFQKQINL